MDPELEQEDWLQSLINLSRPSSIPLSPLPAQGDPTGALGRAMEAEKARRALETQPQQTELPQPQLQQSHTAPAYVNPEPALGVGTTPTGSKINYDDLDMQAAHIPKVMDAPAAPAVPAGPPLNVGSTPVPPPPPPRENAPTGQPGALPGQSAAGSVQPPVQSPFQRDPNEILREAYAPAIQSALEARKRDLERMGGLGAQSLAYNLMSSYNPELQKSGAAIMEQAQVAPIHLKTLEMAGKSAFEVAQAQDKTQWMDADSPLAHGMRLSYATSPMGIRQAEEFMKLDSTLSPDAARMKVYQLYAGATPAAMKASIEMQGKVQDMSESRAKETLAYSTAKHHAYLAEQVAQQVQNERVIQAELNVPGTPASQMMFLIASRLRPDVVATLPPGSDMKMSGRAIGKLIEYTGPMTSLLQWEAEHQRSVAAGAILVPGEMEYKLMPDPSGRGLGLLPKELDREKDAAFFTTANAIYINAASALQHINNWGSRLSGKAGGGTQAGRTLITNLDNLEKMFAAIGEQEQVKALQPLRVAIKDGTIPPGAFLPGGQLDVAIKKALAYVESIANRKAASIVHVRALQGLPMVRAAIGFNGNQSGVGRAEVTQARTSKDPTLMPCIKQRINGINYYFWENPARQTMTLTDEEVPKFEKPFVQGK